MRTRLKAAIRVLPLLVAALAVPVVLAELALHWLSPLPDPYAWQKTNPDRVARYVPSAFPPGAVLRLSTEPGLPGMDPRQRTFTINHLGFRGDSIIRPKPGGEFRIFMVGGSTTECLYLDDAESVTRVLQDRLNESAPPGTRFNVQGAGKSGDKSFDHVALIAHRIVHLQPDMIVLFAGINDLLGAMSGRDYLMFPEVGADGAEERWGLSHLLRFTATEFQLPRLVFFALRPRRAEDIATTSDYRRLVRRKLSQPILDRPPRVDLDPYEENLRSIIGIARANGTRLVLMTQATTWNSQVDPRVVDWQWLTGFEARHRPAHLDAAMEQYNDVVRALAVEFDVTLFDLARVLPKSLDYFYDDVHFNVAGAALAGETLATIVASAQQ